MVSHATSAPGSIGAAGGLDARDGGADADREPAGGETEADREAEADGAAEADGEAEGEADAEADGEAEGEADGEKAEADGDADADGEREADADPEPDAVGPGKADVVSVLGSGALIIPTDEVTARLASSSSAGSAGSHSGSGSGSSALGRRGLAARADVSRPEARGAAARGGPPGPR